MADAVSRTVDVLRNADYWILGTGILPPETPLENVRVIRQTIES